MGRRLPLAISNHAFAVMRCVADHHGDAYHDVFRKPQRTRIAKILPRLIEQRLVMAKPLGMFGLTARGCELLRLKDRSNALVARRQSRSVLNSAGR